MKTEVEIRRLTENKPLSFRVPELLPSDYYLELATPFSVKKAC